MDLLELLTDREELNLILHHPLKQLHIDLSETFERVKNSEAINYTKYVAIYAGSVIAIEYLLSKIFGEHMNNPSAWLGY